MKNSVMVLMLLVVLAISEYAIAAPEDFVLKGPLGATCDDIDTHGDKPHFKSGGIISIVRYTSVDDDYFMFEGTDDFGDLELKDMKMKYRGSRSARPKPNQCDLNAVEAPALSIKEQGLLDKVEHLYGVVYLRGEYHEIKVYQAPKGGVKEIYIRNRLLKGGPIHGGHAHRP